MVKVLTVLIVFMLQASAGISQSFKFGVTTVEDDNLKECAFDPEASAVVLLHEGYSDYSSDNGLMTFVHRKIKILKEDGKKFGDVSLTYYSEDNYENIDNIEAIVINIDQNGGRKLSAVEPRSIFRKKLNKYRSEVSFAFPEVKVGSILEYKYRIQGKHYGALRDWYFQSDIPVYKSSYKLNMVPDHEVSYMVQYNSDYEINVKPFKDEHAIYFEMKNLPAMTDEPFMDAKQDYIQKVIFQTTKYATYYGSANYMSTWKEVTRELFNRHDFGKQIKIKISECQDFISLLSGSDVQKMQNIHHYVMKNVSWNGNYGIIAADGIRNLWKKKAGNSGEINLLLINLLKDAGLEVYPMLVSERGHGKVNKETPFISQFNNVYAAVFIGNKTYYLDATDPITPSIHIPSSILNTTAFIADNSRGGIVDISEPNIRYQDVISIDAKLAENGELTGKVSMLSKDYARTERLKNYINHKTDYIDSYLKKGVVNVSIENLTVNNTDTDSLPFQQAFDFKTSVQNTGDYAFLNLNMFSGFESNPFIVNDRFSVINFGYRKAMTLNCVINVPANFKLDALPKNIKLINSGKTVTFTREIFPVAGEKQIIARIKIDIDKSKFEVNEYPELKEFFKKMISLMNEQVVLKKI